MCPITGNEPFSIVNNTRSHNCTGLGLHFTDSGKVSVLLIFMGDLDAKIRNENSGLERAIEKHGCDKMNGIGERLAGFCLDFDLIGRALFQHWDIHKLTFKSPKVKQIMKSTIK